MILDTVAISEFTEAAVSGESMKTCQTTQAYSIRSLARRGFTLVELLIVIAIIAILAGLAIPAVMMALNSASEFRTSTKLNSINGAIESFRNDMHLYPPDHYYDGVHSDWIDPSSSGFELRVIERYAPLLQRITPNHSEFDGSVTIGGELPIIAWYRQRGQFLNPTNALSFWLGGGLSGSSQFPLSDYLQKDGEGNSNYAQRMETFKPLVFMDFENQYAVDPNDYWRLVPDFRVLYPNDEDVPLVLRSPVQTSTDRPVLYFTDGGSATYDSSAGGSASLQNSLFLPYNFDRASFDSKFISILERDGSGSLKAGEAFPVRPAGDFTTLQFFSDGKYQLITAGRDEIFGWPNAVIPVTFPPEFKDNICSFAGNRRADTVEGFGL